jgi:hypothetical protein
MNYGKKLIDIMRAHDLGALIESDGPIGGAYEATLDVLSDAELNDITDEEAERLGDALDDLGACYDEDSGYAIDASAAHAHTNAVIDCLHHIIRVRS